MSRKKVYVKTEEQRRTCKEELREGLINPMEFINAISHTIGKMAEYPNRDTTSESEGEDGDISTSTKVCVVCLLPPLTTWIFMPTKVIYLFWHCPVGDIYSSDRV